MSAKHSDSDKLLTPFCGPLILTLVCTVRALLTQDNRTSSIPGFSGWNEASPSSRLARFTILYSAGGSDVTDRMLARVWGFTSGKTRRKTAITYNKGQRSKVRQNAGQGLGFTRRKTAITYNKGQRSEVTYRMLARVWGWTSGKTRRNTVITYNKCQMLKVTEYLLEAGIWPLVKHVTRSLSTDMG